MTWGTPPTSLSLTGEILVQSASDQPSEAPDVPTLPKGGVTVALRAGTGQRHLHTQLFLFLRFTDFGVGAVFVGFYAAVLRLSAWGLSAGVFPDHVSQGSNSESSAL